MTLILALIVPAVCSIYINPWIVDMVGDNTFLMLSSEMLANLLMWAVLIGFMVLLGGTMVLRLCGVFGVIGLIFAYWLLGDVTKAIVPIIMLLISLGITMWLKRRKEKKKGADAGAKKESSRSLLPLFKTI